MSTLLKKNIKNIKIAVVGATGTVGHALLNVLFEHDVPKNNITAISSGQNPAPTITYGEHHELPLKSLKNFDFHQTDIAFFSVDHTIAQHFAPLASSQGALVIDKSSAFRLDKDIPLVVPEVNPHALEIAQQRRIISNPNCTTTQLVTALHPIHAINPIKRVIVSTYQSVSGAGSMALNTLLNETKNILMNQSGNDPSFFNKPIAFNVIPQIDAFVDEGDTKEELKIRHETHKILSPDIKISATCARVPVFIGHSMAVYVELTHLVNMAAIRHALNAQNALQLSKTHDDYITPAECAHEDAVYISRLRHDTSVDNGLTFWCVTDNTRKGAALNGVQIAKLVCKNFPHLLRP